MTGRAQAERLLANLRELGARRLIALGVIGVAVLLAIGLGAYYLSQPEREPLYTGLNREDVTRMGGVLKDFGIPFDVSADGTSLMVTHRDSAHARMLLAEKGLPQSANTGYELFNDLGSLGLTSFMQDVTRVRALEGELARTIQGMKGIRAARVHLVLPDRASFRRDQQPASASVVIRTENAEDVSTAQAIRHLVAAAVPGLKVDGVTVLNTDGAVLASGDDSANSDSGRKLGLEGEMSRELEANIRRTLTPYLGLNNFEVSVTAQLDTDKTTTSETVFDPGSKVERSVRVVRENATSQNRANSAPTTVQQNIPQQAPQSQGGAGDSNEENTRREELTNYELSSKTIQTTRDAYSLDHLSIAVLVNKSKLLTSAGTEGGSVPIDDQLKDIDQLVRSATGFNEKRGDQLKVSAVAFADGGHAMEPIPPLSVTELLLRQSGTLINAATILVVALLLIWFGLRPAVKSILARPASPEASGELALLGVGGEGADGLALEALGGLGGLGGPDSPESINLIEDLTSKMNRTPQKRLEQIVEFDEEQAAQILKQWLRQEARAS
ncbi:flagellar basal-body MS-ring/collar protein FliF [Segnochrobactrum spirostomi]|uniref:Flagellar M-ring protein n=1 Tax=Segnochrobactrum spirostomi TaxID=2608987 RepID=A0A6A7Y1G4_9HYPH|nr:flagellar basal-body MS-ring/collar protein FliF [Segnochrobactrum spirostomi]MQT12773.1 flagellar M-ring protein FliF [Segnochrobactrum spirostomi]